MTVSQAFDRIRKNGRNMETIYTCFVTTSNRILEGVVTVKTLLLSGQDEKLEDIMEQYIISANTNDDQEDVAELFNRYDMMHIPIVDSENRLVGIVTVDDAMEIMQEEATEDIQKMAAISPTDRPYMKTSVFSIFKNRIPWLLLLMFSATFTGVIIDRYEDALTAQVALAAFIPMLMDTGGNVGSQSAVTVIRAMSLGEFSATFKDFLKVFWKEFRVAIMCAVVLSAANFIRILLLGSDILVAATISLTLIGTVVTAKTLGCLLPMVAQKVKLDPAVMSSPFITTIADALSLIIYFNIATTLLGL